MSIDDQNAVFLVIFASTLLVGFIGFALLKFLSDRWHRRDTSSRFVKEDDRFIS